MANRFVVELGNVKLIPGNLIRKCTGSLISSLKSALIVLRLRTYLLTFTALYLCGCAGLPPESEGGDPSIAQSHSLCGPYNFTWNGTGGRVYHPRGSDCTASVYSPLVVIFHAAGIDTTYTYADYDYLQQHLARNGFISVSVDVVASSTSATDQLAAAQEAWQFVEDFLWSTWSKRFYINPASIGIIGHSRGGATARYLAQYLEDSPLFQVKSVVSLAPASAADFITGQQATGYLSIYGTADGDTAPEQTFGHYDQAGSDDSQRDPSVNGDVLHKALKLVEAAGHKGYSDLGGAESQRNLTKGYVLAFLKEHNAEDATWYEDYIRGNAVPGDWSEDVFTQYSDGFYRRVIDNFDDGSAANSTLGGVLTTFGATAEVLDLGSDLATYAHDTHALWTWGTPDGIVIWTIPEGKRDVSDFRWLSLRIGQTSGEPANDLRIQIRNGGEWSSEVRLTDHGPITQPTEMCWGGFAAATCQVRLHMATTRVPLTAFAGHDDVDIVRIRFRGDSSVDTFIIDNFEFAEWIYEPSRTTI